MTYYERGLGKMKQYAPSTTAAPERQKRFSLKKGEVARLMILTPSVADVVCAYEHSWFRPGVPDKLAFNMFCTCEVMSSGEMNPRACPLCAEQMFNNFISRKCRAYLWVVDFRVYDIEGKKWAHTPKLWVLGKQGADLLDSLLQEADPTGKCAGTVIDVRRQGDQAANCGSHFQIKGKTDPWAWLIKNSARGEYYQKAVMKKSGRKLTREEAIREYYRVPDIEQLIAPTSARKEYFLAYIRRVMGQTQAHHDSYGDPTDDVGRRAEAFMNQDFGSEPDPSTFDAPPADDPVSAEEAPVPDDLPEIDPPADDHAAFDATVQKFGMVDEVKGTPPPPPKAQSAIQPPVGASADVLPSAPVEGKKEGTVEPEKKRKGKPKSEPITPKDFDTYN